MKTYHITLANGKYLLRLHWAETYGLGPSGRTFAVAVEGKTVLKDFDAVREAGGTKKAVVKETDVTVTDGLLDIEFPHRKGVTPMINGIEAIRRAQRRHRFGSKPPGASHAHALREPKRRRHPAHAGFCRRTP